MILYVGLACLEMVTNVLRAHEVFRTDFQIIGRGFLAAAGTTSICLPRPTWSFQGFYQALADAAGRETHQLGLHNMMPAESSLRTLRNESRQGTPNTCHVWTPVSSVPLS